MFSGLEWNSFSNDSSDSGSGRGGFKSQLGNFTKCPQNNSEVFIPYPDKNISMVFRNFPVEIFFDSIELKGPLTSNTPHILFCGKIPPRLIIFQSPLKRTKKEKNKG